MHTLSLQRILGRGAMGTTYAAEFGPPNGDVTVRAVKVMKSAGTDRVGFRERLLEQGRRLTAASVARVAGVEDVIEVGKLDAVVSTLVDGVDVSSIVAADPMPPRACAEFGAQLAQRLADLHGARPTPLAHRDLKPANVLVTPQGDVWLVDFGVARAAYANREDRTQGLVLGTLNYFPPEVLAGGSPDLRVDLYGLGILLLELASGQDWGPPLVHRDRFDRRVSQRLAALPPDRTSLAGPLRTLLQWDPADRRTAASVAGVLRALATGLDGPALPEWAAHAVPEIRASRRKPRPDDLVGRQFEVAVSEPDVPAVVPIAPVAVRAGAGSRALLIGVVAVLVGMAGATAAIAALAVLGIAVYIALG
ncbi:MAG: serine/threonine protein kinase [Myxococcota bacterium]|jgi:serine/threonine protein kinase